MNSIEKALVEPFGEEVGHADYPTQGAASDYSGAIAGISERLITDFAHPKRFSITPSERGHQTSGGR